jgi:hypothetical protein
LGLLLCDGRQAADGGQYRCKKLHFPSRKTMDASHYRFLPAGGHWFDFAFVAPAQPLKVQRLTA